MQNRELIQLTSLHLLFAALQNEMYEINFKSSIGPSRERNCRKDESEFIDLFFVLYNTV